MISPKNSHFYCNLSKMGESLFDTVYFQLKYKVTCILVLFMIIQILYHFFCVCRLASHQSWANSFILNWCKLLPSLSDGMLAFSYPFGFFCIIKIYYKWKSLRQENAHTSFSWCFWVQSNTLAPLTVFLVRCCYNIILVANVRSSASSSSKHRSTWSLLPSIKRK